MASEKELFITKQYVPIGKPIVENDHTIIYKVKCMAQKGTPDGILKMYRKKNIKNLYTRLADLDYTEWPHIYSVKYYDESTLVVEEYLEGHTLAELLNQKRASGATFTEEEAYDIMERICSGLESLMKIQPPRNRRGKISGFYPCLSKKKKSFSAYDAFSRLFIP